MGACSEALAVDDRGTTLVILALADPHLLESAQGGQDRASDPDGVLALWRGDNLDLHGGRREGSELLGHPLADAGEHGRTARKHHIGVEVLANVNIALHDGLERGVMDAACFLSEETGLKENLGATEALTADRNDVSIWQFVSLLLIRGLSCCLHLGVIIQSNVRKLLLHITNNLALGRGGE